MSHNISEAKYESASKMQQQCCNNKEGYRVCNGHWSDSYHCKLRLSTGITNFGQEPAESLFSFGHRIKDTPKLVGSTSKTSFFQIEHIVLSPRTLKISPCIDRMLIRQK